MPGDNDSARRVRPGDALSASETNAARDRAMREHVAPEMHADGIGTYFTFPPSRPLSYRWGKLDGYVSAGGTQTVSLWQETDGGWSGWDEDSEIDTEDVYCPPTNAGLPEGVFVQIGKVNGRWMIIGPHSITITGYATAAVATTDSTFEIDGVTAAVGPTPVEDTADTITVYNVHSWETDNNGYCEAMWHGENGRWEATQVDCPA